MEDYFSGAYCTIAADTADGPDSGFLRERPVTGDKARKCHLFQSNPGSPESALYICNNIDDFARDVERSYLNTRGWVFQERALSRRTIHFTDTQAYWECGRGVRCETLNRIFNRKSSFLSDPKFPYSAIQFYEGMRIKFFQCLYSRYSTLDFSHEVDRSVAMFGIERRLAKTYGVPGYGILGGNYLYQSLLWQAMDANKPLRKINYKDGNKPPSWSWMAVTGPIKYMDAPKDTMVWDYTIKSPLKDQSVRADIANLPLKDPLISDFMVQARDIKLSKEIDTQCFIYDRPEYKDNKLVEEKLKCVIIGCEKKESGDLPSNWYTLLIIPTGTTGDYERIGVAHMTAKAIDLANGIDVRIV
ncbi:HET-domain-containing protein [Hypoxylon trugodes]|uniref:HET-domain-containing protein n=1 Tax=Hypoxylon trugodes TaxID=326681 RepID=UPI002199B71F|nr:HET-domain-containing protein [Hypoxylon trugodes]KAI1383464.1 HET-domain-containing protein [Hypoxylon trugodes]